MENLDLQTLFNEDDINNLIDDINLIENIEIIENEVINDGDENIDTSE